MPPFSINHLDHVAIRVADMNASADWYERVFGLTKLQPPRWQPYPIFLLAGTTGVALFPAFEEGEEKNSPEPSIAIDHFAFNVSQEAFAAAKLHFDRLGLSFEEKDHYYFHSLYVEDPDGHTVELTTLVVAPEEFFDKKGAQLLEKYRKFFPK